MSFPKPRPFRRIRKKNAAKLAIKDKQRFDVSKIALDAPRPEHINIQVNVKRSGALRTINTIKPIPVDMEREMKKEAERNYEILNRKERTLKSGRDKGEKVLVYVMNNPYGVRYRPRLWK